MSDLQQSEPCNRCGYRGHDLPDLTIDVRQVHNRWEWRVVWQNASANGFDWCIGNGTEKSRKRAVRAAEASRHNWYEQRKPWEPA